ITGENAFVMSVPTSDMFTSQATAPPNTSCLKYAFICVPIQFSYSGTTGKDIAFSFVIADQQDVNNALYNSKWNNGLTGTTAACTSSTTTNMCMNGTDITVGTPQESYGAPAVMTGGGHASSTVPTWFPQKSATYPGWNTYEPLLTLQDGSVVWAT
ncbi:MAG: hypothetical protein KGJ90_06395, partial [Patescibacteria group bacterium]|nr:hypothetical protein [Patescibacteria group bacterium]